MAVKINSKFWEQGNGVCEELIIMQKIHTDNESAVNRPHPVRLIETLQADDLASTSGGEGPKQLEYLCALPLKV